MWRVSERERTILHNLLHLQAEESDESRSAESADPWQIPIQFTKKGRNGKDIVTVSLEDVMKKDRLSCEELDAISTAIASHKPSVQFRKFVDILRPHFIPLFGEEFPEPPTELDKIEHQARIEQLKLAEEEREYAEMTKSIDPSQLHSRNANLMEGFGKELRMMNRELTAIFNTLITVGGAFAFGFFGIQLAYPSWSGDVATKVLIGLVLATLVFFADLYFIVKNMDMEMSAVEARIKEKATFKQGKSKKIASSRPTVASKEKKEL